MTDGSDPAGQAQPHGRDEPLEHAAFPSDLPLTDVVTKFWGEVRKIMPTNELHVIDPYLLDAGGQDGATYAGNVATLLNPALARTRHVVLVYSKSRDGIRELLEQDFLRVNRSARLDFIRGTQMHGRYIIGDRRHALRLEFSFNRIGRTFGTVSVVEDAEDLAGILQELERLHPRDATDVRGTN